MLENVNYLELAIPFPPSANRIWRVGNGRSKPFLSPEYRNFINEIAWLQSEFNSCVCGKICIELDLQENDNRKRDIDNRIKPTLDALVKSRFIEDDSLVEGLVIRRKRTNAKVPSAIVRIWSVKEFGNENIRL